MFGKQIANIFRNFDNKEIKGFEDEKTLEGFLLDDYEQMAKEGAELLFL
ncbi:hypothetical protein [Fervidibacillus halotolerans]|uniref:Uncharacterized protein n=1 Tax=Fervidibacillus halotolerans TaxID=2980027 RepID=A0A9E8M1Y7_9BACI|nr:hypothetical protein [Fervidibacillus halotolerans]WAA12789.1 hypothetical protein OE105_01190 [Fervidibacillus halotolerans]